ncbi:TonB-dependent receptor [Desulfosarcina cetonica]|uniref:TonB-dependent receptor n=1 Tax=Desulfosarcina cetonica TaxID=90730 RepID=UPI000AF8D117|nr:TonB-dependent receptor [Desulfosarcina cetonica]
MENFESIAVYKGAVPADLGTGVGARGGAIELRPLWPEETWGVKFGQGVGENAYSRTFLRLDSGALPAVNTRLSVSGSYTDAEKWKGPGDLGPRKNANIMLSQPINDRDEIHLWYNYNSLEQHLYKSMTYAEVEALGRNYDNDYNDRLTGIAMEDINYYDYNRGDYLNRDFLAEIPLSFTDAFGLIVKPYYSKEDTEILGGTTVSGNYVVQRRMREIERYGLISQLDYRFEWLTASLGYWYEDSDMLISQKNYNVSTLAFAGYGMVMKNDGDGIVHSPYLKLAGSAGPVDWQAGLKYFRYTDPASQGYTASAPDFELVKAADLYRKEKTYDEFLPTVGVDYRITDGIELFASYGRNQIRPYAYVPLVNVYTKNRAAFQAAGVTLDDMFSGYDMETSDNFELGARFRRSWIEIVPTLFYAKHKNLLTTVHDPRIGPNVNYYQNVGEATGYGVELETNFFLGDHVTFFFNPTYTSLTYDEDLTYAGATMDTEGNQVVDTPEWMLKAGLILRWGDFEVVPMLSYLDDRYGDAENTEEVDDYVVANLKIGYTLKDLAFCKSLKLSLEFINLFDEEYISMINAMDDSRSGRTSYYAGAPFTSLLSLSLEI